MKRLSNYCMKQSLLLLLLILCIAVNSKAQSISHATVNTAGNSVIQSGITYEWSIGELALVETMASSQTIITHGFLQPFILTSPIVPVNALVVYPSNILSANGDGKNDAWVIKEIENYPDNEVTVFDRAGRVVYNTRNYQNNWTATLSGLPLAEGTYYYIIKLNKNAQSSIVKGFITILH